MEFTNMKTGVSVSGGRLLWYINKKQRNFCGVNFTTFLHIDYG